MANYCAATDITRELSQIPITSSTVPNLAEVEQFCVDITSAIDARLRAVGIEVPVTDTDLLKVVKPIAIDGVKAKVCRANVEGEQETAAIYEDLYQRALARIETRPAILQEVDNPGCAEGTARADTDIRFTKTGDEW